MTASLPTAGAGPQAACPDALAAEIRAYCAAHADPRAVARYARYFTEGYDAYGVPESALHVQRQAWLAQYREPFGLAGFLDLGDLLWASGKYEAGFLAIYFAGTFKDAFTPETLDRLGHWFALGVRNWAHCDVLCGDLLGRFLTRGIVPLDAFGPWRESPFKFQRRAVPVTMLALLKDAPDYARLLAFIRPLMQDRERVVQQGTGWFLREAWKRAPEPVEAFLLEWKDSAPRVIFQYATEKMTAENKAHFRKGK